MTNVIVDKAKLKSILWIETWQTPIEIPETFHKTRLSRLKDRDAKNHERTVLCTRPSESVRPNLIPRVSHFSAPPFSAPLVSDRFPSNNAFYVRQK